MSTTEYRKFTYQGATFIVGTDGSVDGLRHYGLVGNGYMMLNRKGTESKSTFSFTASWPPPGSSLRSFPSRLR